MCFLWGRNWFFASCIEGLNTPCSIAMFAFLKTAYLNTKIFSEVTFVGGCVLTGISETLGYFEMSETIYPTKLGNRLGLASLCVALRHLSSVCINWMLIALNIPLSSKLPKHIMPLYSQSWFGRCFLTAQQTDPTCTVFDHNCKRFVVKSPTFSEFLSASFIK